MGLIKNTSFIHKVFWRYLFQIALPFLILLMWHYVTKKELVPAAILPSLKDVYLSFQEQISTKQLFLDLKVSLTRVIQGYTIAALLGIFFGVTMGISKKVEEFFKLTFTTIRQIPMIAWIPLIILWFGIDEISKITIIVIAAFFPILLNTINGIKKTDKKLIEVGYMYNLTHWEIFRKIYLPSAIPSIFVGLKLGLGISWMAVVGAEIIAASSGIGYRITEARSLMEPELVFVGIITIGLIGLIMDSGLTFISKKLLKWE